MRSYCSQASPPAKGKLATSRPKKVTPPTKPIEDIDITDSEPEKNGPDPVVRQSIPRATKGTAQLVGDAESSVDSGGKHGKHKCNQ